MRACVTKPTDAKTPMGKEQRLPYMPKEKPNGLCSEPATASRARRLAGQRSTGSQAKQ